MTATVSDRLAAAGIDIKIRGRGEYRTACPECARSKVRRGDDALAVKVDDRGAVWSCFRCGWSGAANHDRSATGATPRPAPRPTPEPEPDRRVLSGRWRTLWETAQPVTADSPVGVYLASRCCALPGAHAVRWLPELPWQAPRHLREQDGGCAEDGSTWPCMMSMVTDILTGAEINLHRSWVRHDGSGKADVPLPRLMLPNHRKKGGVVALTPVGEISDRLVVGEGIETVLSGGIRPVWALIDGGNLGGLPVLDGVQALMVLVDHDAAGLKAWRKVAARWCAAGRDVRRVLSPTQGSDFNDWVAEAAPSPAERARWLLNRRYEAYDPERDAEDRDAKKWLASVTATLLRRRVPPVLARRLVHALNRADCEPGLPPADCEAIVQAVAGRELQRRGGAGGR